MRARNALLVAGAIAAAGLFARWATGADPEPWHARLREVALACASLALALRWPWLWPAADAGADVAAPPSQGAAALRPLRYLVAAVALLGLSLCLAAHLVGVFGLPLPPTKALGRLFSGVFVVTLPAMFLCAGVDLRAWPWRLTSFVLVYTIANFCTLFLTLALAGWGGGEGCSHLIWRGATGHVMLFYSVAAALAWPPSVGGTAQPAPDPGSPRTTAPPRREPVAVPQGPGRPHAGR